MKGDHHIRGPDREDSTDTLKQKIFEQSQRAVQILKEEINKGAGKV
jgi:hypothetical protein